MESALHFGTEIEEARRRHELLLLAAFQVFGFILYTSTYHIQKTWKEHSEIRDNRVCNSVKMRG